MRRWIGLGLLLLSGCIHSEVRYSVETSTHNAWATRPQQDIKFKLEVKH